MKPVEFYAYHGTSLKKAEKITRTKAWNPKRMREDHWLGHGSYFYREDFEQAEMWASFRYGRDYKKGNDSPAVVEIKVNLESDKFLNLDSRDGINFLQAHIDTLIKERGILIEGQEELLSEPRIACLVFSSIDQQLKWVILKTFPVYSKIYSNSPELKMLDFEHKGNKIEFNLSGTQVCVRNNEAIKEMSIKLSHKEKAVNTISIESVRRERVSSELFDK